MDDVEGPVKRGIERAPGKPIDLQSRSLGCARQAVSSLIAGRLTQQHLRRTLSCKATRDPLSAGAEDEYPTPC
jgi:hypothetical protein